MSGPDRFILVQQQGVDHGTGAERFACRLLQRFRQRLGQVGGGEIEGCDGAHTVHRVSGGQASENRLAGQAPLAREPWELWKTPLG